MKIAIRGHKTRGQEVIKILKSLGGKQGMCALQGHCEDFVYFIRDDFNNLISCNSEYFCPFYNKIYTLEEFEREFPFKVGDLCVYSSDLLNKEIIVKILGIAIKDNCIMYEIGHKDIIKAHSGIYRERHTLKPYKEMKEKRNITLTLEKAKEWYKSGGELREIALQAFTEDELSPLPKSWEEFIKLTKFNFNGNLDYIEGIEYWSNGCLPNKSIGESSKIWNKHLALFKLEQLRNCYRQGWKPDWNDLIGIKYCIAIESNTPRVRTHTFLNTFLTFQSREIAEEFLKNFKPLIKEAGDLI